MRDGQTTNNKQTTEDRATQPMEAGGWSFANMHTLTISEKTSCNSFQEIVQVYLLPKFTFSFSRGPVWTTLAHTQ